MTTAFQSNAFQKNAFQIDAVAVVTRDTHDGFDEESHKRIKEELGERAKAFKSARERLREALEFAWDGPQTEAAAEVKAIAAPHVERMESGALRIDYAALAKHRRELLAFHAALRSEYDARIAAEQDEEEVMILLWS